jgi:predicted ATPase/transcriptional regulator with XRE-family HTH domain
MAGTDTPDFATILRRCRRDRHLTQEELAERAGVSPAAISLLERGLTQAPQRGTVELLAAALDLGPDDTAIFDVAARQGRWPDEGARKQDGAAGAVAADDANSGSGRDGKLPIPLTPLFGREHDEDTLLGTLHDSTTRLLTLIGPAGVGKTRLALRLAMRLLDECGENVVFVDLIPAQEPARVLSAIAGVVDVQESGSLPLRDSLIQALRRRKLVLLLDNFEQALSAARLVMELLIACPEIKALVTSRSPLNVRGERCYLVEPLALPDQTQLGSLDTLRTVPTVALFLDRAAAAQPQFTITALEEGQLIAGICARLDGLPLAIELAAARVRHIGLRQLHDWLTQRALLGALMGGPQDLADHQRTMRAAIAWSYDLLSGENQRLFRWLSVFVGGASVDAVERILDLSYEATLKGLSAQVDANLLQCVETGGARRYKQLVTMQAYAQEQLQGEGEAEEAQRRHATYFLDLTQLIEAGKIDQPEGLLRRLELEYENVRASLTWAWEIGATTHGLRMVASLWRYWFSHTDYMEGLSWLERFIWRAEPPTTREEQVTLAEAWTGVVALAHRLDQFERARAAGERALALRHAVGDKERIAHALSNLANPVTALHDYARAIALYEESLGIQREINNREGMVFPLLNLGDAYLQMGKPRQALTYYEQSIALSREVGETDWARALTWSNIGEAYIDLDEPTRAVEVTEPSYDVFRALHDVFGVATCAFTLGRAHWRLGNAAVAKTYLDEAERSFSALGSALMIVRVRYFHANLALDQENIAEARRYLADALAGLMNLPGESEYLWWLVERTATVVCRAGKAEQAARLYGAVMAHRDAVPRPIEPAEAEMRMRDLDRLRGALGETTLTQEINKGRALAPSEAVSALRDAFGTVASGNVPG